MADPNCLSFEIGVSHGGKNNTFAPGECQLNDAIQQQMCNGKEKNTDVFEKKCKENHIPLVKDLLKQIEDIQKKIKPRTCVKTPQEVAEDMEDIKNQLTHINIPGKQQPKGDILKMLEKILKKLKDLPNVKKVPIDIIDNLDDLKEKIESFNETLQK